MQVPQPASVVQLVRTLSIMRVVMSSSPDWSENFPHHLCLMVCDYRGMAKWFGAHYIIRRSLRSAWVQQLSVRKVLTPLLSQGRNFYYFLLNLSTKGQRHDSLYPGFNDESVVFICLKSLNPGLKTIVPFALRRARLYMYVQVQVGQTPDIWRDGVLEITK